MSLKINYFNLRSKATWRSWCYLTHRLIVAHLHPRYDKSMSKDIKVATRTWVSIWRRIIRRRRSNPTKTICLSSLKGRDIICSCWTCKYGQTFCPNIWLSFKQVTRVLHISAQAAYTNAYTICENWQISSWQIWTHKTQDKDKTQHKKQKRWTTRTWREPRYSRCVSNSCLFFIRHPQCYSYKYSRIRHHYNKHKCNFPVCCYNTNST